MKGAAVRSGLTDMAEVVALNTEGSIVVRTSELRFVRRKLTAGIEQNILQQKYKDMRTNVEEWRDVPVAEE